MEELLAMSASLRGGGSFERLAAGQSKKPEEKKSFSRSPPSNLAWEKETPDQGGS